VEAEGGKTAHPSGTPAAPSQLAALVPVDCNAARSRSKVSKPKPIRGYGLRQEEDRNRAVTSDPRSFSGLGIRKKLRRCNRVTPSKTRI
jgi:hypothetical protein